MRNLIYTIFDIIICYHDYKITTEQLSKAGWYFINSLRQGKNIELSYNLAIRLASDIDLISAFNIIFAKKMVYRIEA